MGARVHQRAVAAKVPLDKEYRTAQLDMLLRLCMFDEAEPLFAELTRTGAPQQHTVAYNTMINGLCLLHLHFSRLLSVGV